MENIFKNAYFGKPYKTRDGRKAIFWHSKEGFNFFLLDKGIHIYNNNGVSTYSPENYIDIVSEWQEEINEEELDKIALEKYPIRSEIVENGLKRVKVDPNEPKREYFKVGYRKGKEK